MLVVYVKTEAEKSFKQKLSRGVATPIIIHIRAIIMKEKVDNVKTIFLVHPACFKLMSSYSYQRRDFGTFGGDILVTRDTPAGRNRFHN